MIKIGIYAEKQELLKLEEKIDLLNSRLAILEGAVNQSGSIISELFRKVGDLDVNWIKNKMDQERRRGR